jgi:hypothetical protein
MADFLPNWDISQGFLNILSINIPLFKKLWDIIEGPWLQKDIKLPMSRCLRNFGTEFFFGDNHFMSHFSGHFEGASTFLTPKLSLEMAHKVIVPQKKLCPAVS